MARLSTSLKVKSLTAWLEKHVLEVGIGALLFFLPLYPKLPLIDIRHTWVYIRFEDFLVALVAGVWLILLAKRKVTLKTPLTIPIFVYWSVGLFSLLFAIFVLSSQMTHFFPKLAILHYFRRIEYMVLFFVAAASVKDLRVVKKYLVILGAVLTLVCLYGFGQKLLNFPAFLTTNEEFAKGQPLFLGPTSRISSTFAGPYDLAAYLVLMIGLFSSLFFGVRRFFAKVLIGLLLTASLVLMVLTASRISLVVCLAVVAVVLWMQKKKWLLVAAVVLGIVLASQAAGSLERFGKTFRVQEVVYNQETGMPVATVQDFLSPPTQGLDPNENLPLGSGFLSLGEVSKQEVKAQILRKSVDPAQTATVSSRRVLDPQNYLVKKAIVYDISFTTRYQGQWPRAYQAFGRNILLGSGYSSISLATDNDYLRALGETGLLGFLSFFGLMTIFGLLVYQSRSLVGKPIAKSFLIGILAGWLGLMLNAVWIDVFEASKVAYPFWILAGITVGMILLFRTKKKPLLAETFEILGHPLVTVGAMLVTVILIFGPSIKNYFIGDDFTWLRWALATNSKTEVARYFVHASGFFYRPLAKVYFYLVAPFFGLQPYGYHLVSLLLHFAAGVGVYLLARRLTNKRWPSSLAAILFLIHPINSETVYWLSTTSHLVASLFYLWGFLVYVWWRQSSDGRRWWLYLLCLVFYILGLASHERMVTFPLILIFYDLVFVRFQNSQKLLKKIWPHFAPWAGLGVYLWVRNQVSGAHQLSGDYSYNLGNLIFNLAGNLFGYLGELVASFHFIPVYDWLRSYLRSQKLAAVGLGLILILAATFVFRKIYPRIKIQKASLRLVIFATGWFLILMIPFLGLGNIAERYVYPAHFGYFLVLALSANWLHHRLVKKDQYLAVGIVALLSALLVGFYLAESKKASDNWHQAGETVNQILASVHDHYDQFPLGSRLYFVDLPIRQKRAWVLPVGLKDGLWFIYQDESLAIDQTADLSLARSLAKNQPHAYIFLYQNGRLKEVEK